MTYISQCLADGAVGLWGLGEASGTAAVDQAAIHNGVYTNATGVSLGQTGIPGGGGSTAVLLTAANSGWVNITNNNTQNPADTFTMEAWVKLSSLSAVRTLFSEHTGGPGIQINSSPAGQINIIKNGTSTIASSTSNVAIDSVFHHIVWTKATATNHLYLDGADVTGAVTNATVANSGSGWGIGANPTAGLFMDGTVAMVALYPTALSSGTVASHFSLGSTAPSSGLPQATNSDILFFHSY